MQQHVIERLLPLPRRGNGDVQVLADPILADVLVKQPRAQTGFVLDVIRGTSRGNQTIVRHGQ